MQLRFAFFFKYITLNAMLKILLFKDILIVKNYPKIDTSAVRIGFPMGERLVIFIL